MSAAVPEEPLPPVESAPASFDELMLAMDVVDTLRHDAASIESEIAVEERDEALVARIRELYAAQGIEVSSEIAEEAVRALRDGRFVWTPPARTLRVRLAELYVSRARWGRRLGIALGSLAAMLAIVSQGPHLADTLVELLIESEETHETKRRWRVASSRSGEQWR